MGCLPLSLLISSDDHPLHSSRILSDSRISSRYCCFCWVRVSTLCVDSSSSRRSSASFLVFSAMLWSTAVSSARASSSSCGSQSASSRATSSRFSFSSSRASRRLIMSGRTDERSSCCLASSLSSSSMPCAVLRRPSLRPSCNFMRHSYHIALLSSLAWVLTFLNWLSIKTLNSGDAVMYSRKRGGFSSKVSVSISRTMRRPSEMYFFNSRQDCVGLATAYQTWRADYLRAGTAPA
jgi:hypothetical protein